MESQDGESATGGCAVPYCNESGAAGRAAEIKYKTERNDGKPFPAVKVGSAGQKVLAVSTLG